MLAAKVITPEANTPIIIGIGLVGVTGFFLLIILVATDKKGRPVSPRSQLGWG